jgi:hypothetical protein
MGNGGDGTDLLTMVADNMARPIDRDGIEGGDEARFLRAYGDTRATIDTGIPIDNEDNRHRSWHTDPTKHLAL